MDIEELATRIYLERVLGVRRWGEGEIDKLVDYMGIDKKALEDELRKVKKKMKGWKFERGELG